MAMVIEDLELQDKNGGLVEKKIFENKEREICGRNFDELVLSPIFHSEVNRILNESIVFDKKEPSVEKEQKECHEKNKMQSMETCQSKINRENGNIVKMQPSQDSHRSYINEIHGSTSSTVLLRENGNAIEVQPRSTSLLASPNCRPKSSWSVKWLRRRSASIGDDAQEELQQPQTDAQAVQQSNVRETFVTPIKIIRDSIRRPNVQPSNHQPVRQEPSADDIIRESEPPRLRGLEALVAVMSICFISFLYLLLEHYYGPLFLNQ